MPESDTLFEFPPHTEAKHKILRKYIEAWAPILCQSPYIGGRVVYIDGFAGPGEDITRTKKGSPLIALEAIVHHKLANKFSSEVVLYFIEINTRRAEHLEAVISQEFPNLPRWISWEVDKGRDFNKVLTEILKSVRMGKAHLAPAFCFVDPFGWQDLNYDTLSDFMMEPHSELFITFMSGFINRFLESERHHESLESIFGNEQLTDLQKIENTEERTERMLYFFKENLKSRCKSKGGQKEFYDIGFKTRDRSNNKLYHLLYLTSNEKGMDVMKKAMYNVSRDGSYTFSDFYFDPDQRSLLDYSNEKVWIAEAANELKGHFTGSKQIQTEVMKFITCHTRWIFEKKILKLLEQDGFIEYLGRRSKPFTYPDDRAVIVFK